ncbi:MAG: MmcQ/YjbR family DNA-binding protein [Gemmatimonadaceae bacterium]
MATRADVRRIALSLPNVQEDKDHFAFSVPNKGKLKGFVWVWMERVIPKEPRVANPGVIAIRVANLGQRDALLSAEPAKFFTEPHYEGFPAVLVRLDAVTVADLKVLLAEGWRCMAPAELAERKKAKPLKSSKR